MVGEAEMDDDGVLSVVIITRVESRAESDSQRRARSGVTGAGSLITDQRMKVSSEQSRDCLGSN